MPPFSEGYLHYGSTTKKFTQITNSISNFQKTVFVAWSLLTLVLMIVMHSNCWHLVILLLHWGAVICPCVSRQETAWENCWHILHYLTQPAPKVSFASLFNILTTDPTSLLQHGNGEIWEVSDSMLRVKVIPRKIRHDNWAWNISASDGRKIIKQYTQSYSWTIRMWVSVEIKI